MKTTCALCEKSFNNILEHLSISHNIKSIDDYEIKSKEIDKIKRKQEAFRIFISDLNNKYSSGKINGEQYRELSKNWKWKNE